MFLTVREIFVICTSVILAITIGFLVNWNFSELLTLQTVIAYFLIGGIIGILIYGFKPRAEKFFKKYEKPLLEGKNPQEPSELIIKQNPYDENIHLQNLNIVYRQLSYMRLWETGNKMFVIQVPKNIHNAEENDRLFETCGVYNGSITQWTLLNELEPNLKRAIQHLKSNITENAIISSYHDLQTQIVQYNKKIPHFVDFIDNHILQVMSKKTKYEESKNNQEYGYNVDQIRHTLFYLLTLQTEGKQLEYSFKLEKRHVVNSWITFVVPTSDEYTLIYFEKNDPDEVRDQIGNILFEIARDEIVLKEYKPYYQELQKMFDCRKKFREDIRPLIEKIEHHGYVVTGKCDDLPY